MIVALFGVICVGKTTIGRIISERLGFKFFDLDAEIKSFYDDTLTNIYSDCICRNAIDKKKAVVLKNVLNRCGEKAIIAISPIYYTMEYKHMFIHRGVLSIVLQDTPENIADRMVDTDDNDIIIENRESDRKEDIKDIKYFISRYKSAYRKIPCHYHINGKSASEAADDIINKILKPAIQLDSDL